MERDRIVDQEGMLYNQFNSFPDFELIEKYAKVCFSSIDLFRKRILCFVNSRILMFSCGVTRKNNVLSYQKLVMRKLNVSGKHNDRKRVVTTRK